MKYFIVADVHGFYKPMMKALNDAGFDKHNPDHTFVSLGDLLDRGEDPVACLEFVNSLDRKILIKGNHEDLMCDMLSLEYARAHDYHNGTIQTIINVYETLHSDEHYQSARDAFNFFKYYQPWRNYLKSLVDYAEVGDYIFVHGWIPKVFPNDWIADNDKINDDWRHVDDSDWNSARWLNGMDMWRRGYGEEGKTICCGHWHTSYGHAIIDNKCSEFNTDAIFTPFEHEGICALDACTAHSGFVNCKVIEV